MLIKSNTQITFPGGALTGTSKIIYSKKLDENQVLLVAEATPFHPVDHNWPDQPADKGSLSIGAQRYDVTKCIMAALNKDTHTLLLDQEIKQQKIRRDDVSWFFLVAHIVTDADLFSMSDDDLLLREVGFVVDAAYRSTLSKSHTACHLAALALNKCTAEYWTKPAEKKDSLGHPNLDAEAIMASNIQAAYSEDRYRCGKSLRKKGFDEARFFNELNKVEDAVNNTLAEWCSHEQGLKISVTPAQTSIDDKREWVCKMPSGIDASIPCGGTHVTEINATNLVSVSLMRDGDAEFVMQSKFV